MASANTQQLQNWSGNYIYRAKNVVYPKNMQELQAVIARSTHIGVIGTRHTFNAIADTDETLISMQDFETDISLDTQQQQVTVTGNVTYGQLANYLDERGFAVHNMASLPHISVIGACMTGTHGSGQHNGNLATAVESIEFVAADGTIYQRNRVQHPDEFDGLVVGLGAYGIVTRMTLTVVPRFDMQQNVWLELPFEQAIAHFDAIQDTAYSVSLFTNWSKASFYQVWTKSIASQGAEIAARSDFFGATPATESAHPLPGLSAESCTEQMGHVGAWHDRLPHFRLEFTPSQGHEIQTEYFVPRDQITNAISLLSELGSTISPLLFTSEVRTIAADHLWLSPCYQRDSVALHFTWKPLQAEVEQVTALIEEKLQSLAIRPHWGKVFTLAPATVRAQYERLGDFQHLVRQYDPQGKFANAFLSRYVL